MDLLGKQNLPIKYTVTNKIIYGFTDRDTMLSPFHFSADVGLETLDR